MTEKRKTRSSKSSVTFTDLPIDVFEKVVKKLDLLHCLRLRKVSRGLRRLVDSSEIHCEELEVHFERPFPKINFEDSEVVYNSASLRRWKHKRIYDHVKIEEIQKAIVDVSTFLKNPRVKIEQFNLHGYQIKEFVEFLKSLDFQLDVRAILIGFHGEIDGVLQCFKPGNLEEIALDSYMRDISEFDKVAETEQWRKAGKLQWKNFDYEDCRARMEKVLHFKEVVFQDFFFDEEHLGAVRDILLKSTNLEFAYITPWDFDPQYLKNEEQVVRILSQNPAYNAEYRRFSIPDSRDYFQLDFEGFDDYVYALIIKKISVH